MPVMTWVRYGQFINCGSDKCNLIRFWCTRSRPPTTARARQHRHLLPKSQLLTLCAPQKHKSYHSMLDSTYHFTSNLSIHNTLLHGRCFNAFEHAFCPTILITLISRIPWVASPESESFSWRPGVTRAVVRTTNGQCVLVCHWCVVTPIHLWRRVSNQVSKWELVLLISKESIFCSSALVPFVIV